MKFFGNGIVFHPLFNNILAEFKNGEYETFKEDKIKELLRLGYESDLEEKEEEKEEEKSYNIWKYGVNVGDKEEEKEVIKAKNKKIGGKK